MDPGETRQEEIKKCRPGSFIIIDDEPSVVTDLKISKPGNFCEERIKCRIVIRKNIA